MSQSHRPAIAPYCAVLGLVPELQRVQTTLVQGMHDMMRGSIAKEIQKHVESKQAQEEQRKRRIENRAQRAQDQVFEKKDHGRAYIKRCLYAGASS